MHRTNPIIFCIGMILCLQTRYTEGAGNFYVGLLGYNNTEGIYCCRNETDESTCVGNCGLIFEIHVSGLNGTVHSKNLSDSVQLSLSEAITIPTSRVTNPLSFQFTGWPGQVNVSVVITATYNGNVYKQFDVFEYSFGKDKPTDFYYISQIGSSVFDDSSRLTSVFRYRCVDGTSCFGDCLEHNETEACPPSSPNPTSDIYTGFTDPACQDGTRNCSTNGTTPSIGQTTVSINTTATPTGINETTDSAFTDNTTMSVTTQKIDQDNATSTTTTELDNVTFESNDTVTTATQDHVTTTTEDPRVSETSTVDKTIDISTTTSTISPEISNGNTNSSKITTDSLNRSSSASTSRSTVRSTRTTVPTFDVSVILTTPDEIATKIDEDPVYWPAIVGGVLGGIALMSAIGFCLYYRRQKKLRKRQEIYNVNPKVLRNFEEYEENGTSGRADVPLETEQY